MKDKLEILCAKYNLTASSLAKALGVEASAISHIRSGRNKPSYDFVVKILRAFPDVDPDWLLLDGEELLRSSARSESQPSHLFSDFDVPLPKPRLDDERNIEISESLSRPKNCDVDKISRDHYGAKQPKRVIVLYSDGSFESYEAGEF